MPNADLPPRRGDDPGGGRTRRDRAMDTTRSARGSASDAPGEPEHGMRDRRQNSASPPLRAGRRRRTDKVVFGTAAVLALAFVLWGVVDRTSLAETSTAALTWFEANGGWAFVLAASGFVVFVLWLALSRYGRIRLGRDEEEPEFRTSSWIAMMFSAGMGIGLIFFGVAEPLAHFTEPPPGTVPLTGEAPVFQRQDTAMATTLFHWTLHPWAIYAIVGLSIAYGTFRRGRSQLISSAFIPLIGEKRAASGWGKAIDILAIFATLFGSAASLGLGTLQISRGLQAVG
ncbi:MAG TPA: BCCT family transporter, partial [Actinopolymorphaceae bacterium]